MQVKKIEERLIQEAQELNNTNPNKTQCATQAVMNLLTPKEMCEFATLYDITMDHIIDWVEKELRKGEEELEVKPNEICLS